MRFRATWSSDALIVDRLFEMAAPDDDAGGLATAYTAHPAVVIVLGAPGSGRSAVCSATASELKCSCLEPEALLKVAMTEKSAPGVQAMGLQNEGKLLPPSLWGELVAAAVLDTKSNAVLLDVRSQRCLSLSARTYGNPRHLPSTSAHLFITCSVAYAP